MADKPERVAAMLRRVVSVHPAGLPVVELTEESSSSSPEETVLGEAAIEGAERALDGRELTYEQADALEAIILPYLRPVYDVVDDTFHPPPAPWRNLDERRAAVEAAITAVGRIEIFGHPRYSYAGTGFLVGPDLLLTARHVARLFVEGSGTRRLRFDPGLTSAIDFKREVVPVARPMVVDVAEPLLIHPYWDVAVLRLNRVEPGRAALRLASMELPRLDGRPVVVIGHPDMDSRNDANIQYKMFRGLFGCKRLLPGYLMGYRRYLPQRRADPNPQSLEVLAHDCSTLGGNSGSAVLDITTGDVVGLHFAGEYLTANYAVPAWELAADPRVIDLGVNVIPGPTGHSL